MRLRRFAWIDALIIGALIAGALLSIPLLTSADAGTVFVYRDNRLVASYPLDTDRIFPVKGRIGEMLIEISRGTVRVRESSCKYHLCMKSGAISNSLQQLVCAPNHILIEIGGRRQGGIDAISR